MVVMCELERRNRAVLRRARELMLEGKEIPLTYQVSPLLASSWRRSAEAGLMPEGRLPDAARLSEPQLAQSLERKVKLVLQARPVMEFLHAQVHDTGSMVLLANEHGVILQVFGDAQFLDRAERVALMPGSSWNESHRGTNAIGTCLHERRPLMVHGGEHFLERNGFLSCAAAPIKGPDGMLLGVLDISGDERKHYSHSLGLVRAAAQTLENRLFESCHAHHIRLHFHALAEGIGTFSEGAVALSENGWIIGATPAGLAQLGLSAADLGVTPITRVLQSRWEDLLDQCLRQPDEPQLVTRVNGHRLFVRIDPGKPVHGEAFAPPPHQPSDALATIDYGDEAMATLIGRARKLMGTPIAVLLQGEPGVGKAYFARALHVSGPRHAGPFVTVNCGAVQENLLESELFGHLPPLGGEAWPGRLREADGGTLFIEEIADLPLPLQTRLLDVIQKKQLTPRGGKPQDIDFVLICATTRHLKAEVEAGRFRADLYYHISGMTLRCPPLRERKDFSPLLTRRLKDLAPERNLSIEPELALAFANYTWPGNITQLTNVLRAACALLEPQETRIGWQHLPDDLVEELRWPVPAAATTDECGNLRELSQSTMARAIALSHGNMSEAARRLGISRNTLYRHMRACESDKPHIE
ncbi:MAG: sigma-54-dependent Fis family transcriptional regulator [Paludibacterium sp.]|uniref:sigma-54-dependent Fis family transcriptional regulator n=1 Tax=Paludibacterium sp. TaxID=1917523 RepID=UPI0025EEDF95|nr:sigma-54-dependent Fis family transcriptional regulator [Paludibacterium sp.]MBV8047195.1 sigma-54-dependent Fis family transcriptional regulator [Paludibacterium sp.]MBV8646091.1 sigma-54-dependent Fis family transcriptional regulator [Paludibacterium sp.]